MTHQPTIPLADSKNYNAPAEMILTGADQTSQYVSYLNGKRVGILANQNIDFLAGTTLFKEQIIAGTSGDEIRKSWEPGLSNYKTMRQKYTLYK